MELVDDSLALPGFPPLSSKFGSTEEEFVDSDEIANFRPRSRASATQSLPYSNSNFVSAPPGSIKQESRRRPVPNTWLHKMVQSRSLLEDIFPYDYLFLHLCNLFWYPLES